MSLTILLRDATVSPQRVPYTVVCRPLVLNQEGERQREREQEGRQKRVSSVAPLQQQQQLRLVLILYRHKRKSSNKKQQQQHLLHTRIVINQSIITMGVKKIKKTDLGDMVWVKYGITEYCAFLVTSNDPEHITDQETGALMVQVEWNGWSNTREWVFVHDILHKSSIETIGEAAAAGGGEIGRGLRAKRTPQEAMAKKDEEMAAWLAVHSKGPPPPAPSALKRAALKNAAQKNEQDKDDEEEEDTDEEEEADNFVDLCGSSSSSAEEASCESSEENGDDDEVSLTC
jgi:hypothetical protein